MREFVAARFTLTEGAAQLVERFYKERLHVVWLEPPRLRALHIFPNAGNAAGVHSVVGKRPFFQEILKMRTIHGMFYGLSQTCPNLGLISITDGFDQEIPQRLPLELQLAKNVENLPAERFPGF